MTTEKVLKALANKRRLKILKHLDVNGKCTVSDISQSIKLSMKATSKHLQLLYAADLLERDQRGLRAYYDLSLTIPKYVQIILADL